MGKLKRPPPCLNIRMPTLKTLYGYIARKIVLTFIVFFAILTLCILSGYAIRITELVVENGFSLASVLKMLAFLVPTFLALSMPIALLMSTAYAFMDFKTTKEAYAMASHGVSPKRLYIPVGILGIIGIIACAWTNGWLMPLSQLRMEHYAFSLASQKVTLGIKEATFIKLFPNFTIYITRLSPARERFEGVYIHSVQQGKPFHIFAKRGIILSNPKKATLTLRLLDGTIQYAYGESIRQEGSRFGIQDIDLKALASLKSPLASKTDKRTATITELLWPAYTDSKDGGLAVRVELNKRLAMSLSPLLVALFGAYLGLLQPPRPRWVSLIFASLVVLFNYMGLTLGESLALRQVLPAWVGLEMVNGLLFVGWLTGLLRNEGHFLRIEPFWNERGSRFRRSSLKAREKSA